MKDKVIIKNDLGKRLDTFLATKYPNYSRSAWAKNIKDGLVFVNGKIEKPGYLIRLNDIIQVDVPMPVQADNMVPQDIPLNIIYEDKNVIVINKQPGILVHPGAGNPNGTIVNALINHFPDIKNAVFERDNLISSQRPGIVHRLDKDTSGVMIIAKNKRAMHSLARQIQNRAVEKTYLALCYGWPKEDHGRLVNFLGRHTINRKLVADIGEEKGKEAISDYQVLEYLEINKCKISLLEFNIHTGRTHQIRVQSKLMGHPVMGDYTYGTRESIKLSKSLGIKRQLLHAYCLKVTLLDQNKATVFNAEIPNDFQSILASLKSTHS